MGKSEEKLNNHISQNVMEQIKKNNIAPRSKWKFQAEEAFLIFFLAFFLLIGSIAISLIFELADQLELESVIAQPQGMKLAALSFPYFWLIVLMVFAILAAFDFWRTRNGYRYRLRNVALVSASSMVFLGAIIYIFGISGEVHSYIKNNTRYYSQLVKTPDSVWDQPEEGLLSGVVISADKDGCHCLKMMDWDRHMWNVDFGGATIHPGVHMEIGESIKVIGREEMEGRFEAEKINPWNRGFLKIIRQVDREEDRLFQEIKGSL